MKQVTLLTSFLETGLVSRIRRNHGLEHATLHLLAGRHPRTSLAGHSDGDGFWIIGDVPVEAVQSAVAEALRRMKAGEGGLAVHPFCGTNFVTSGVLAGAGAAAAMFGARRHKDWLERLPLAISLATLALIISQPLGLRLQETVTTSGKPGSLEVVEIQERKRGALQAYRIVTRG